MKKKHKTIIIWVLIVMIAVIGLGIFFSLRETAMPDDLLGAWITPDPMYADRFFELKRNLIIFGTGGSAVDIGNISQITETAQEERTLYTIYYDTSEGVELLFSFFYEPTDGGQITLKNQEQIVWRKTDRDRFDQ